jgi:protein-disulfide isomerase
VAYRAGDVMVTMKDRMLRSLCVSVAAILLFAVAGPAQKANQAPPKKVAVTALDKPTLEAYVRHLFVAGAGVTVQISDPKPSDLPGFVEETVHLAAGPRGQDVKFLISKDGSKILQGNVYDVANNPFKPDLNKLTTDSHTDPNLGTAGAPVVIVAFSDFECPYCKEEAKMIRQNLLAAYPTQVRLYFKPFPLESIHPWSKAAAIDSKCVYKQNPNAFWSYHDWIFEHQTEITAENLKDKVMEWAKTEKDVDGVQLAACIDSKATEPEVDATLAQGKKLEIDGTPTLFINGRRINQTIDWANLKTLLDDEIEYQKTAKNAGDDCGCDLKLKLPGAPAAAALPGSLGKH